MDFDFLFDTPEVKEIVYFYHNGIPYYFEVQERTVSHTLLRPLATRVIDIFEGDSLYVTKADIYYLVNATFQWSNSSQFVSQLTSYNGNPMSMKMGEEVYQTVLV